jgi:putative endopeptidase
MTKSFRALVLIWFLTMYSAAICQIKIDNDPIDFSGIDSSVRPQDNFYLYANGKWIKNTQIPPSLPAWGNGFILAQKVQSELRFLLDSVSALKNKPANSPVQQTADFYYSAMDSAGIEKSGLQPVMAELKRIGGLQNLEDLYTEIAVEYADNHGPFFNFYVTPDQRNSAVYAGQFNQGGLGMLNKDYYLNADPSTKNVRDGYIAMIEKLFLLSGYDSAKSARAASTIIAFETELAKISKSPTELRDPVANYHKFAVKQINATIPDWNELLVKMNIRADSVVIGQPEFYSGLTTLLRKTSMADLKEYLRFHVLYDDANYLPHEYVNARFGYTKLLGGQRALRDRWKRMITLVDKELGDALGQLYVQKYFTPASKQRIQLMVDNLMSAFSEKLKNLDWMTDSTRKKAFDKLDAISKKIGYPATWKDYSSIQIVRNDVIANLRNTAKYRYIRDLSKIGKPVDHLEWDITTPTINAYYDPTQNTIIFPAGILQPPFFYPDADDAVNYGAIGIIIGHEITHGFDDEGRQYDGKGNLKDWWSPEDALQFKQKAANIVTQYNAYIVIDTFHVNGSLTEGENLADNGGLALAYAAFKKTAQGKSNEQINGLTPDERFFLSGAQLMKEKTRDQYIRMTVMSDPHTPFMYRANGSASNSPAFYKTYHVQPGDLMYRDENIRVNVW